MIVDAVARSSETLLTRWTEYPDKGPDRETFRIRTKTHDTPAYLEAIKALGVDPLPIRDRFKAPSLDDAYLAIARSRAGGGDQDDVAAEVEKREKTDRREIIEAGFPTDVYPQNYTPAEAKIVAPAVCKHLVEAIEIVSRDGETEKVSVATVRKWFASEELIPHVIKRFTDDDDGTGELQDHRSYMGGYEQGVVLALAVLVAAVQAEEFKKRIVPLSTPSVSTEEQKATGGPKRVSKAA